MAAEHVSHVSQVHDFTCTSRGRIMHYDVYPSMEYSASTCQNESRVIALNSLKTICQLAAVDGILHVTSKNVQTSGHNNSVGLFAQIVLKTSC